jgi:hypothetical protein
MISQLEQVPEKLGCVRDVTLSVFEGPVSDESDISASLGMTEAVESRVTVITGHCVDSFPAGSIVVIAKLYDPSARAGATVII